jgi:hypothetical protein
VDSNEERIATVHITDYLFENSWCGKYSPPIGFGTLGRCPEVRITSSSFKFRKNIEYYEKFYNHRLKLCEKCAEIFGWKLFEDL